MSTRNIETYQAIVTGPGFDGEAMIELTGPDRWATAIYDDLGGHRPLDDLEAALALDAGEPVETNHKGELVRAVELPRQIWFAVYDTTRLYGGPEEGGWYYNSHRAVMLIQADLELADVVQELKQARSRMYPVDYITRWSFLRPPSWFTNPPTRSGNHRPFYE